MNCISISIIQAFLTLVYLFCRMFIQSFQKSKLLITYFTLQLDLIITKNNSMFILITFILIVLIKLCYRSRDRRPNTRPNSINLCQLIFRSFFYLIPDSYILASDFCEKDDKYVFKARNLTCV